MALIDMCDPASLAPPGRILIIQADLCTRLGLAALAALAAAEPQEGQQDEARHTAANDDANRAPARWTGRGGGQVTKAARWLLRACWWPEAGRGLTTTLQHLQADALTRSHPSATITG